MQLLKTVIVHSLSLFLLESAQPSGFSVGGLSRIAGILELQEGGCSSSGMTSVSLHVSSGFLRVLPKWGVLSFLTAWKPLRSQTLIGWHRAPGSILANQMEVVTPAVVEGPWKGPMIIVP